MTYSKNVLCYHILVVIDFIEDVDHDINEFKRYSIDYLKSKGIEEVGNGYVVKNGVKINVDIYVDGDYVNFYEVCDVNKVLFNYPVVEYNVYKSILDKKIKDHFDKVFLPKFLDYVKYNDLKLDHGKLFMTDHIDLKLCSKPSDIRYGFLFYGFNIKYYVFPFCVLFYYDHIVRKLKSIKELF